MKPEVVVIPVSDVDRAKRFYRNLGWRLDADFVSGDECRVGQVTPPGSSGSIRFGTGVTSAVPSRQGRYRIVSDFEVFPPDRQGRSLRSMGRTRTLQCRAPSRVQTTPQVDLKKISGARCVADSRARAATSIGIWKGMSSMKTHKLLVAAVLATAIGAPIAGFVGDMTCRSR